MKLIDLRKLAVRKRSRIRFPLANSGDCLVNETGIATVPGIAKPADFNLEEQFSQAQTFFLEPVADKSRPQKLTRADLEALVAAASKTAVPAAADHDD